MSDNIRIPSMLLVCVYNEREIKRKKIHGGVVAINRYYRNADAEKRAEHKRKQSESKKRYWAELSAKKRAKVCANQSKAKKAQFGALTKEELLNQTKAATAKIVSMFKDPLTRDRMVEHSIKNFSSVNNKVTAELPRINDYSGVISLSDMEKLYA